MKVMFTLEFSEDERLAIAHERGDIELGSRDGVPSLASLESVQNWARRKIEAAIYGLVQEYKAKQDLENEELIQVSDLKIERWRSTGSVADDANAVRILHVPSRIVVESSERAPFLENRRCAMAKLRERLADEKAGLCPICHYPVNSGPCQRSHP
jgi:hypothetical protein